MSDAARRQALLVVIARAFEGVRLEDGTSLRQADVIDAYGSQFEFEAARRLDETEDWRRVSDADLQQYNTTFCFADEEGARFYLPAKMSMAVRCPGQMDSHSVSDLIYFLNRAAAGNAWLTPVQCRAIREFLRYILEVHAGDIDEKAARSALEAWSDVVRADEVDGRA